MAKRFPKLDEYVVRIGTLIRTIRLTPYEWGIDVCVEDRNVTETKSHFNHRKFHYNDASNTLPLLVRRIEKYYKIHVGRYYQPSLYSDDGTNIDWNLPNEMASFQVFRFQRDLIACMEKWGYDRKDYIINSYEEDDVEQYTILDEDGNMTLSIEIY